MRVAGMEFGKHRVFEQLHRAMMELANSYPNLSQLYSIGKTLQGRDLWVMEITNHETGPAEEKPAMWMDGNTHSPEVTGSAVCLKTIWYLLDNYGKDPLITELLDTRAFYILPRLNPDGAEIWLSKPYHRTAAGIPNPDFEDGEGFYEEDVDGDGKIVQMRIKDPNGNWKISKKDQRIMLKRELDDTAEQGPFYRILTEGMILKYKPGIEIKLAPSRFIGGTNRNFPAHWTPGGLPLGAVGPFPLWEREIRAVADFWSTHPNLASLHSFHTSGGLILRESITKPDGWFAEVGLEADLAAYKAIARMGEDLTGYPAISPYEEFTFEDDRPFRRGTALSFFYEHMGVLAFSVELWDFQDMLGLGNFRERGGIQFSWDNLNEEQQLKVLQWIDREMNGSGFVNWKPFKHPQLGDLEIGGIDIKYTRRNPPSGKWLNYEIDKTLRFAIKHASLLPLLRITATSAHKIADQVYKIEAQIENTGYLPTNITQMAIKIKAAKPVIAQLKTRDDVELVSGYEKTELGHLDGRSSKLLLPRVIGAEVEDKSKRHVEWVVKTKGAMPTTVSVVASCPRAGIHKSTVTLN